MKSPSNSVGIIDPEGIRKGSNKKERMTKTNSRIGKNDFAYSTITGSRTGLPLAASTTRDRLKTNASKAQINPVPNVRTTSISAKSKLVFLSGTAKKLEYSSFLVDLQHGQESLLGNFHGA